MKTKKTMFGVLLVVLSIALALPVMAVGPAEVEMDINACEASVFSASASGSGVTNQFLSVDDGMSVQSANIPTNGSSAEIFVGPFSMDTLVSWNVFGGGERDYDQPLWNGYGTANFSADIAAYAASQGGFGWVLSGVNDTNPFVNWNDVLVLGCFPEVIDDCKKGGWDIYGFKNQGQCVRYVETGRDSR